MPDDFGPAQSLAGLDPDLGDVVDWITDCRSRCGLVLCGNGLQTGSKKIVADARTIGPAPFLQSFRAGKTRPGRAMKRSALTSRAGRARSEPTAGQCLSPRPPSRPDRATRAWGVPAPTVTSWAVPPQEPLERLRPIVSSSALPTAGNASNSRSQRMTCSAKLHCGVA